MTRQHAIDLATAYFDHGDFQRDLAARVAIASESQLADRQSVLHHYLAHSLVTALEPLGFVCHIEDNPVHNAPPFLIASRREADAAFGVLCYGHGDVVRGQDEGWKDGLAPWRLTVDGDRWYGRGTADNKGQHSINLGALASVIQARDGKLGYDVTYLFEMGEEIGSPGLNDFCKLHAKDLRADLFLASDGTRLSATSPTVFLGSRGGLNFRLQLRLRDSGYHSGNWGGILCNPAIRLAHALSSLVGPQGRILVPGLLPDELPDNVRNALRDIVVGADPSAPKIDPEWGEPGLTPAEQVFGWNTLEILDFKSGTPDAPINAIPGQAFAHCQIRYVIGSRPEEFLTHIRTHLDQHGFNDIELVQEGPLMQATRLNPDDPWVKLTLNSLQRTTGLQTTLLPNLGGSLPNDVFAQTLGLPTIWVPHGHPSCGQHAPNEHLLASVGRQALQMMAGLYWDLGDSGAEICQL